MHIGYWILIAVAALMLLGLYLLYLLDKTSRRL